MRLRRAVGDGLRHRVRLAPDDVAAQIPAVRLERERDAPRDAHEVFRLEAPGAPALRLGGSAVTCRGSSARRRVPTALAPACVPCCHRCPPRAAEPESPRFSHTVPSSAAPDAGARTAPRAVRRTLGRRLQAELPRLAVVAESPSTAGT